jgi:hypothetical protein
MDEPCGDEGNEQKERRAPTAPTNWIALLPAMWMAGRKRETKARRNEV